MEISYIKKTKNGVEEEMVEIIYKDVRYPNSNDIIMLSMKDANLLAVELNKFVADIPY